MSTAATLRRRLQEAIDRRSMAEARLESTRAKLVATIAERDASGKLANEARLTFSDLLGSDAPGSDKVERQRTARDKSAEVFADNTLACDSLRGRVDDLEEQHKVAVRDAAQAAEAVATHVALERREDFRLAMLNFAETARDFHRAAFAAERASTIASGGRQGGEPVPHRSFAAARLQSDPDSKDGYVGALDAAGLTEHLVPMATRIAPMSERELMDAVGDAPDATENGSSSVASATSAGVAT
jgi:hypothetical protein